MKRRFLDISHPKRKNLATDLNSASSFTPKRFIWIAAIVFFVIFIGVFVFNLWTFKGRAKLGILNIQNNFQEAAEGLRTFQLEKTQNSLQSVEAEINSLKTGGELLGLTFFDEIKTAFMNMSLLGKKAVGLGNDLTELSNSGFGWLVSGQGEKLISKLESLKNNLNQLGLISAAIQNQALKNNLELDNGYLTMGAELQNNLRFLDALISWLQKPRQQFLVLFQNASELRPAGGFIGSYAHLTLQNGSLTNIDVRDIYDPDGQLDLKVIPPKPLQFVTPQWGARDANWFFDFPLSAGKVIQFLESSKMYKEKNISFGGAAAINMETIRDLLSVTGPIYLEDYGLEINDINVLEELQREVEEGQDKQAGQPKKILKALTPILFEKLGALNEKGKADLAEKLGRRLENKDIMIYFKDLAIESYLQTLGVAGEMAIFPEDFSGSYLAVVNANIGGHKTDEFIKQKIALEIDIGKDGQILNNLEIERRHFGQDRKEWWYKAVNKDYLQVFVPAESKLISVAGNDVREIKPRSYGAGYKQDSDVASLESSYRKLSEFGIEELALLGRTIFGAWLITEPGETDVAKFSYLQKQNFPVADGSVFDFMFEKQSGITSNLDISVMAPAGYVWKENGRPVFTYSADTPPARVNLKMTLSHLGGQLRP